MRRFSSLLAAAMALGVFVLGVARGSRIAGGADSSGYISEAASIARGRLIKEAPLARQVSWPRAEWTFAPLGWRPGTRVGILAPTYPIGYPLTLAAALKIAGPRATFLVVPALGALAVWCTFVFGRRIDSQATGLFAAVLLGSSPPFVFQLLQPMSDVPATAWWIATVVLAAYGSPIAVLASGLCASVAVLTRPNLAPIGAAIGLYLVSRDWIAPPARRRLSIPLLYAVPFAVACAALGWIQNQLYGSPFTTGYGSLTELYALQNYTPNLHRYTRWLFDSETRLVLAGLIAPLVLLRRRDSTLVDSERMRLTVLGVAISLITFASYLFYAPFDNWTYLRYLLPAYPALFVLAVMSVRRAAESLGRRGSLAFVAIVCATIVVSHVGHARTNNIVAVAKSEQRYERIARYMATHVLGRPAFIGMQHTGSVAYYSDRVIVRWDWLGERVLDQAIADLHARGYRPMILLEEFEEKDFKVRFASELYGKLDWPPRAMSDGPPAVRLYDPADRALHLAGERWPIEEVK